MTAAPAPTVTDVNRIAAVADPIVRNLQITQCYAELSAIMAARTGIGANWCTFATWASKQAGQTIRQEDLVRRFRQIVTDTPALNEAAADVAGEVSASGAESVRDVREVEETLWDVLDPKAPFDRASDAVARGNRKVFVEIGYEFARFYAGCFSDMAFSQESQNLIKTNRKADVLAMPISARPGSTSSAQGLNLAFRLRGSSICARPSRTTTRRSLPLTRRCVPNCCC